MSSTEDIFHNILFGKGSGTDTTPTQSSVVSTQEVPGTLQSSHSSVDSTQEVPGTLQSSYSSVDSTQEVPGTLLSSQSGPSQDTSPTIVSPLLINAGTTKPSTTGGGDGGGGGGGGSGRSDFAEVEASLRSPGTADGHHLADHRDSSTANTDSRYGDECTTIDPKNFTSSTPRVCRSPPSNITAPCSVVSQMSSPGLAAPRKCKARKRDSKDIPRTDFIIGA